MESEHTEEASVHVTTFEPAPAALPREPISQSSRGSDDQPPPGSIRKRHAAFVGTLGLVTAAVWIAAPVAVRVALVRCEGITCLSMEKDLARAMDPTFSPCHDFYQHVCGRWTQSERFYNGPM
ncbi:hypothetical protein HPB50_023870 [Hyalomma asiaticum]|uniref:Uncharacterized protein n=1 Tax=Hyalomma asiaticum TaxID=266040 RepID=A0ACB7SZG1_HYAAI|nr:hypothetical protein HPB50_023870 [Hyalomma asiaticum]